MNGQEKGDSMSTPGLKIIHAGSNVGRSELCNVQITHPQFRTLTPAGKHNVPLFGPLPHPAGIRKNGVNVRPGARTSVRFSTRKEALKPFSNSCISWFLSLDICVHLCASAVSFCLET
jgi:hypothetical protein